MNLVVLQFTKRRGWVLTYNGSPVRSFQTLEDATYWLARNPDGWTGDVQVQIIGTLASITGRE